MILQFTSSLDLHQVTGRICSDLLQTCCHLHWRSTVGSTGESTGEESQPENVWDFLDVNMNWSIRSLDFEMAQHAFHEICSWIFHGWLQIWTCQGELKRWPKPRMLTEKWCGAPFPLLDDSNVYGKTTSGQLQEFPTLSHSKSSKSTWFNMDLNGIKAWLI